MVFEEFMEQLEKLRQGELKLDAPTGDGLSRYAGRHFHDLKEYICALESGYRKNSEELQEIRRLLKIKTLAGLLQNQWSTGACRGYMIMAMRMAAFTRVDIASALGCLEDVMDLFTLRRAEAEAAPERLAEILGGADLAGTHGPGDGGQVDSAAGEKMEQEEQK